MRIAAAPRISSFIGIDWSGAKGPRQSGIQLAEAHPGRAAPVLIECPDGRLWGRAAVFDFLVNRARSAITAGNGPVFVGIDFAFAHPFADTGAYFPDLHDMSHAPADPAQLWALIDAINADEPDFYGGAMFAHDLFGDYYLSPRNYAAPRYASRRRHTEHAARHAGRSPTPTFKAVGADNVATGSMAGMRLLHHLRQTLGRGVAVWPFATLADIASADCGLIMAEIFPSFHFHRMGFNPARGAAADAGFMTAALAAYDSDGVAAHYAPRGADLDEADAMIAAAALRWLAPQPDSWIVPDTATQEGWIFGVPTRVPA